MAKRSREDFEPLSPVSGSLGDSTVSTPSSIREDTETQVPSSKILQLDSPSGQAQPSTEMRCSLPPHRQTLVFASYEEYEVHYNKSHVNRCMECRKNFPTEHFLNLHIEENHDALVSVKRERGEKTVSISMLLLKVAAYLTSYSIPALLRTVIGSVQLHRRDACTWSTSIYSQKTMTFMS